MSVEELDVIVAGAGLSGIGAAYRLKTECPQLTFAVLEGRDSIGGTWDLFRYPGVRSDSDMFTLGFPFHPWKAAKAIADGPSILEYVKDTARRFGIEPHIRFRHRVVSASWSSSEARWTVRLESGAVLRCRFLYLCCGYYDYASAHAPEFKGRSDFQGRIVHPQWWPKDLDYSGKRVVVIGSGATAVTVVPAMASTAAHVTMLQRSPTFITSLPAVDAVADLMRRVLPERLAHSAVRWKNIFIALGWYWFCRFAPRAAARLMVLGVRQLLPKGYPVEKHFTPTYDPWDQRLCFVPDADLFKEISAGRASVVTDAIECFDATGIRLVSGQHLDADVIVTATGLKILPIGGVKISVDGREVRSRECVIYKGLMLGDVPNLAFCVGYTNASWTLRADLSSRYVCRVLRLMHDRGFSTAVACADRAGGERRPLFTFNSGYVQRAEALLPRQGARAPWLVRQNYVLDAIDTLVEDVDDEAMSFS